MNTQTRKQQKKKRKKNNNMSEKIEQIAWRIHLSRAMLLWLKALSVFINMSPFAK